MDMIGQDTAEVRVQACYDSEAVHRLIPHRPPFLFLDRVEDLVGDVSAVGVKNVSINEPYFQGHFPGRPIMPGVLIIECMAQTSGVLVLHSLGETSETKLVYFLGIENAKFRKIVAPGDQLRIHVQKRQRRANVWKYFAEAKVEGKVVAEATYSAMLIDR